MSWEQDAENLRARMHRETREFRELWGIHSYAIKPVPSGNKTGYFLIHQPNRSILTEPRPRVLLPIHDLYASLDAQITAIETADETLHAIISHPTEHPLVIEGLTLITILPKSTPEVYRTQDALSRTFRTALRSLNQLPQ